MEKFKCGKALGLGQAEYSLNNIVENNTIGMTQFKSIKKPNIKFPIKAPPRPNVSDKAAAITLHANEIKRYCVCIS